MLDIDHFKHINDTWGHEAGDDALRAVAASVSDHARPQDLVARFGGEEFCLLVPGMDTANAASYFETLRERIGALRIPVGNEVLQMTVSIGLCTAHSEEFSLHDMLSEADKHLYLAKAGGRNQVRFAA
jgi:diguanylate cyclase (GGDEF)-like protein